MNDEIPCAWSRAAAELLTEIVMAATNHNGPFLIVEGPTDQRFLELKVDTAVYFVPSGGRDTCISLIKLLNDAERPFCYLGIADADYDWLAPYAADNLVLTDTRDIEGIQVRSSALDSVIVELADSAKVAAFVQRSGSSIREALLSRAVFFGRVRALGYINGNISFEDVKPARFCKSDWTYDEDECARVCVTLGLAPDKGSLLADALRIGAPSEWHFARGHDLVDILMGGLSHVLSGKQQTRQHIEALLRQTMQRAEFEATELFNRVQAWEQRSGATIWKAA